MLRELAAELRDPTPETLVRNVAAMLWELEDDPPGAAHQAAERLQALIATLTHEELAALLGAA
jgi:hypothetical protein